MIQLEIDFSARELTRGERRKEYRRAYYLKNREREIAATARWNAANREAASRHKRAWREKNRDYDKRPERVLVRRLYKRLWKLAMSGRGASRTLGLSGAELRAHIESLWLPGMSWDNRSQWHLDHIRPCASFDMNDPAQFKECWSLANLRPIWAKDNLRKGSFYNGVRHYHRKAATLYPSQSHEPALTCR